MIVCTETEVSLSPSLSYVPVPPDPPLYLFLYKKPRHSGMSSAAVADGACAGR